MFSGPTTVPPPNSPPMPMSNQNLVYVGAGTALMSPLLLGGVIGALIAGKGKRTKGALIGASVPPVIAMFKM